MDWIKWSFAFLGHGAIWCFLFNRIHATSLPRRIRKQTEKWLIFIVTIPIFYVLARLLNNWSLSFDKALAHPVPNFYFVVCILLGVFFFLAWFFRNFVKGRPRFVSESKRETINVQKLIDVPLLHGWFPKTLGKVPFNQALTLSLQRLTFDLDIPQSLDGFKICHLSDLHYTTHVGIEYFQKVVEEANRFAPDLTIITGDIIDVPECLDWIKPTIGQLRATHGVHYVLGNHDCRIKDEAMLRGLLADAGMTQSAGNWNCIDHNGGRIHVTGNELPWYPAVNELGEEPTPKADLRILLSHSPDQLYWASKRGFDLMFAGHTHGGQIALPLIGPMIAPSRYGVLFASGTFKVDKMGMHVSRGVSGDEAIRICCPPEIGMITLRSKT